MFFEMSSEDNEEKQSRIIKFNYSNNISNKKPEEEFFENFLFIASKLDNLKSEVMAIHQLINLKSDN